MAHLGMLAGLSTVVLGLGAWEAQRHRHALRSIPLRIHVNGTRGKTSVTEAITALFRELGRKTVGKCTGTLPMIIDEHGREKVIRRRGNARIQEQVTFLRYAARVNADVAVVECMALEPTLQWVSEHRLIRSHIGVITNVRQDHFEEMGADLQTIARSLANTIPRNGVLVTSDGPYVPFFLRVAQKLNTRVVVAEQDISMICKESDGAHVNQYGYVDYEDTLFRENKNIACTVAQVAGFPRQYVARAAEVLRRPVIQWSSLSETYRHGDMLVHAWAMNDIDSFGMFWHYLRQAYGADSHCEKATHRVMIPLFNHRHDRPLRTLAFGRLFASWPHVPYILLIGERGAEQLFRKAGVEAQRLVRLPTPCTRDHIARIIRRHPLPVVVVGCGNALGADVHKVTVGATK